jgi:hypothetical protein
VQDVQQSQIVGKRHPCPCIRQLTNQLSTSRRYHSVRCAP